MFKKGNEDLLDLSYKRIGIIGARNSSIRERYKSFQTAQVVVSEGHVVVSGLAHGVDMFAHMGGIERTIAVVHNLVKIYPKENIKLSEEIIQNNGLLISPYGTYEDDYKIGKKAFLDRDRMLVDICDEIIIIGNYGYGSGTEYTVNYAEEKGLKISNYK